MNDLNSKIFCESSNKSGYQLFYLVIW